MKIGITIGDLREPYNNGLKQNAVFLYKLLMNQNMNMTFLVNKEEYIINEYNYVNLNNLEEVSKLDLILEVGLSLGNIRKNIINYNNKIKFILILYGNKLLDLQEKIIFSNKNTIDRNNYEYLSEIWTSPHYKFMKEFVEVIYKINVKYCPYIWESEYLQLDKYDCLYEKNSEKNICVMEAHHNHTKTSIIPGTIIEKTYNKNKDLFNCAYIFATDSVKTKRNYIDRVSLWNIVKDHKMTFEYRYIAPLIFSKYSNVLVSHQINNGLNYLYLEALYLGLPVIHNSEYIKDVGYYYPGFDCKKGSEQLVNALKNHDNNLDNYLEKSRNKVKEFSIHNQKNIDGYLNLINNIMNHES